MMLKRQDHGDEMIDYMQKVFAQYHPMRQKGNENLNDAEWVSIGCSEIADVTTLDGFFTAIISAPNFIASSTWMPMIWGKTKHEPKWVSREEHQYYINALMSLYNAVAHALSNGYIEPLLMEINELEPRLNSKLWLHGYLLGSNLWMVTQQDVIDTAEYMARLMVHIEDDQVFDSVDDVNAEVNLMLGAVLDIHEYYLTQRMRALPKSDSIKIRTNKRGATKSPKPLKRR